MFLPKMTSAAAAFMLLAACEAEGGRDKQAGPSSEAQPGKIAAAGKAEEGQLSIKAPGFDMKIDIPKAVAGQAQVASDNPLIYPGASVSGMHIEAGAGGADRSNGVEIRFATAEPLQKVAAWYRAAARQQGFSITSERGAGGSLVFTGTQKSDGDPFTLRLDSAADGTQGRLTLGDRR